MYALLLFPGSGGLLWVDLRITMQWGVLKCCKVLVCTATLVFQLPYLQLDYSERRQLPRAYRRSVPSWHHLALLHHNVRPSVISLASYLLNENAQPYSLYHLLPAAPQIHFCRRRLRVRAPSHHTHPDKRPNGCLAHECTPRLGCSRTHVSLSSPHAV